ncbi:MAG: bacterial ammonia monooxygenase, subunit AmoB [Candidatus Binatia bacterium]
MKPRGIASGFIVFLLAVIALDSRAAWAHGERNQEPFLRMRTIHWYDVSWSADKVGVNDEVEMRGKFRVFEDWPKHLFELAAAYLNLGTRGPVFVKVGAWIGETPVMQSTKLEYGRDYEFRLLIKARVPGEHHVHPMINIEDAGPLLGPGKMVEVTGNAADFVYPLKTIDKIEIANLETWAIGNVVWNHLYWAGLAVIWLAFWMIRGPVLIPRYRAMASGREDSLISNGDRAGGAALVVITLVTIAYGVISTNAKYPRTSALQGGRVRVFPLPAEKDGVDVRAHRGDYDVPGRSLRLTIDVENNGSRPIRLGEFTAANLRFVNRDVPEAVKGVDPSFPQDLIAPNGLQVSDPKPIAPGEKRTIKIEASDAAWETERLASLMGNPDSSYGALLFFFDDEGKRTITEVSGPAIPVFTSL